MSENYFNKNHSCKDITTSSCDFSSSRNNTKKQSKSHSFSWFLMFVFAFLFNNINAQTVASYTFSESAGTYTALTTPTTVHASGWDDAIASVAIPFTFYFNSVGYTTCSVNTNGYLTFGATTSATTSYTPISSATAYSGAISALGIDLTSNSSIIDYKVTGSAPNRVLVIEWNNAARFSATGNFNFQIRLNETTNVINIVYGSCAPTSTTVYTAEVGLRGAANTDYNNRSLITNVVWDSNTTAGAANNASCRTRSTDYPNSGRTFTWTPPVPTITSLGSASGCAGSSITINGTNFFGTSAANVQIGGTAVSSITSNNGTQIVAVIGSGTTGTATVTTYGGTATSAATFTVNPVPVITAQPVATSSCTTGSTTFSVTATGATTYQWRRAGVNLTNVAPYSGVTTSTLTITNPAVGIAGSFDVIVGTAAPCTVTSTAAALTVTSAVPAASITPSPTNAATGVCYSGTGAISSVSWAATATATSYDVYFGAGSLPGSVTSNVTTNSYSCGTLAASTTYYWKVVAKNICGSAVGSTQWTFTTASLPCASCTPASSSASTFINDFSTTGGNVNITNNGTGYSATGYGNFTATKIVSQCQGASVNISVAITASGGAGFALWVDWDDDGAFAAGERMLVSSTYINSGTGTFAVPAAAIIGNHRMRILADYITSVPTNSCGFGSTQGEAEDYTFTVNAPPTITSQPTTPTTVNCQTGTVAVSVTATGATTYQWRKNGSNLTNVPPYSNVTTATMTITNPSIAENGAALTCVISNGTCPVTSNSVTLTVTDYPAATTTPNPANGATGVCYSGTGAITSVSWSAVSGATSYNVYFGTTSTPPYIGNQTATTYSTGTLLASTTYYWKIIAKNTCGDALTSTVWSFTTASLPCPSCTPSSSSSSTFINNFSTTGGVVNITNNGTGYSAGGYGNFTATKTVSQYPSSSVSISVAITASGGAGFALWVDWNDDGTFAAGERMLVSSGYINSATGTFAVPATAPIGNHRMRILADYITSVPTNSCAFGSTQGEAEDYTFTVIRNLCAANPTSITVNVTTNTTATVTWTAASPAPASGYDYYVSTSNVTPAFSATPTGSTAAGVTTVNLTGLTPGTTYYIWVRSNCGGTDGPGDWVGPVSFFVPLCTIGNSTGTTVLACPSVTSGGVGLNGADPTPITCTTGSSVDLEATYLSLGNTTTYTVSSIAYNPPYQFGCLKNPVSVNVDDIWSPVVNLPFTFCFYGNTYSSCIIGSNGIIRFGSNGSAGSASGYAYNSSLPSTTGALFANSIYGVYHDIDPSIGGEVGWELITLNTGCRALVASWSNVPMYYDNSKLYTGMMVLYENTNVIEVYIHEKRIDGADIFGNVWNNGNAIVGVQNAAATAAVVAPGRNGTSTDWTATDEAWRFVPSGTSITSLAWHTGGASGPVVGTTTPITVSPTTTTTYTAVISYALCGGATLTETDDVTVTVSGNKTWTGATNTDWNTANNWSPTGVPTALDCVIIPNVTNDPIISGTSYNGLGYSLTIQNGGFLTVNSNNSITITDFVNVNTGGQFDINNNASLIQTNNVANTGTINSKRNATINTELDYVYWSSPVGGNLAAGTMVVDNIASPSLRRIYTWQPTGSTANGATGGSGTGTWTSATGSTMALAKGYIAQPSNGFTGTLNGLFAGTPNNGNISYTVSRGSYQGANYSGTNATQITNLSDNYNLVGNPYPSAISANNFLYNNRTVLQDGIRIWKHGIAISSATSSPFYGTYQYNYSPSDYYVWDFTGGSAPTVEPDYMIGSGQAFFVTMQDGAAGTNTINFNNALRSTSNSTFFRNGAIPVSGASNNIERHRIWMNITGSNQSDQCLVGYVGGATNEKDVLYDSTTSVTAGAVSMYSLINEDKMVIQGKSLPFSDKDTVPLGYNATASGDYSIGIVAVDGLFSDGQKIFLEDKSLNTIYDLRVKPYVFSTEAGTFDNRFVLRYTDSALGNDSFDATNSIKVFTNQKVIVNSSRQNIKSVVVFDLLGRKIDSYENVNNRQVTLSTLNKTMSTLILQITLEDGVIGIEKVTY